MVAKKICFKMIPLMWPLLLQGEPLETRFSSTIIVVFYGEINSLVPPYKRQYLVRVDFSLRTN